MAGANVTDVGLNCIANTYTISGTVSGLTGSGLILRNNGTDNRSISANGAFAFNTAIASSNPYSVTVFAQPTGQSCNVTGGNGTVAAANVNNVQVSCVVTSTYTISGNVSGPLSGTPFPVGGVLTLQNNAGDPISLTNYGAFTFPTALASGSPYNVTVSLQPATNWTCVPTRATGVVGTANITDIQVSCVDNTVVSTGSMGVARNHHSATLLADGKVMVAGGWATSAAVSLSSAEIFDPIGAGAFTATAPMNIARSNHTATLLLASGKVLVAGGLNGSLNLNSAEVFDPAGTFSLTGTAMTSARSNHAVALLGDGTVLLAGGRGGAGSPIQSAEIYDPATGTGAFSATTGPMAELRMFHTATRLNTGMVLIVGGKDAGFELLTAEIYDPVTRTFSATGAMSAIRQNHTATLLADGKVLIVGGAQNGATGNPISSAEVYDPITGLFHPTGNMATARADHAATLLANGKVLISGGRSTSNVSSALRTMEIYDPASGLFANAGSMSSARTDHAATLLLSPVLNPRVLITGGYDGTSVVNTADLFVPQ